MWAPLTLASVAPSQVRSELSHLLQQEREAAAAQIAALQTQQITLQNNQVVPFTNDRVMAKNSDLIKKLSETRSLLKGSQDEVCALTLKLSCGVLVSTSENVQQSLDEWRGRERLYVDEISMLHKQLEMQVRRVVD